MEETERVERAMDPSQYLVTNRARGRMLSHASAEIFVRDFPPIVSDERPAAGGEDKGPTPLEFILVGLCA